MFVPGAVVRTGAENGVLMTPTGIRFLGGRISRSVFVRCRSYLYVALLAPDAHKMPVGHELMIPICYLIGGVEMQLRLGYHAWRESGAACVLGILETESRGDVLNEEPRRACAVSAAVVAGSTTSTCHTTQIDQSLTYIGGNAQ